MKNRLRVKTFAEVKKFGWFHGTIVFLKEKVQGGYICDSFGFLGWVNKKDLKPLSNQSKKIVIKYIEEANNKKEFYEKALAQIEKEK